MAEVDIVEIMARAPWAEMNEPRACDTCDRAGTTADASATEDYCGACGETIPHSADDLCSSCGARNHLLLACPDCGGRFSLTCDGEP